MSPHIIKGKIPEIDFGPFEEREISISDLDRSMQVRVELCTSTVDEYAGRMDDGHSFPKPAVFDDGEGHLILADGYHTVAAHERRHKPKVACKVYRGTKRDAFLYAASANSEHGLPLSVQDKRKLVELFLADEELTSSWSSRRIARHCGLSHTFVEQIRKAAAGPGGERDQSSPTREGLDGKKRKPPKRSKPPTGNAASCDAPAEKGGDAPNPATGETNGMGKPTAETEFDAALFALYGIDVSSACRTLGLREPPEVGNVKLPDGTRERCLRKIDAEQHEMIVEHQERLTELQGRRLEIDDAVARVNAHNQIVDTAAYRNLAKRVRSLRKRYPRRDHFKLVVMAARELEQEEAK
jgi:hypothetical protein